MKRNGYGVFRSHRAHRVAFFLEHKRWPQPCALHKCDNRRCVRPDHLFEGTLADNNRDCAAKGRSARLRGDANPLRKKLNRRREYLKSLEAKYGSWMGVTRALHAGLEKLDGWMTAGTEQTDEKS